MKKLLLFLVFASLVVAGCYRNEPVEYRVRVQVYTPDSIRATNVYVEVGADVPGSLAQFKGYTNEIGEINFTYNAEAVLKIRASRGNPLSFIGCGFVRLKPEEEVLVKVYLQPYDPVTGGGC